MKKLCLCIGFLYIAILFSSCHKEDLPKASEKGANTFGCKIEGKSFVPQQSITYPAMAPLVSYYNQSDGSFQLSVSENSDKSDNGLKRYLHMEIVHLVIGANTLNETNRAEVSTSELNNNESFTTTETVGGVVNITHLDTYAKVISGTFSFSAAINPTDTPGKIINVTEGRFDVAYK